MEELNLSKLLKPDVRVELDGEFYVLRTPTEGAMARFQSARYKGARVVNERVEADLDRIVTSQSLLVSLCLFTEQGKPVPQSRIDAWPAQVVAALFERAHAMAQRDRKTAESLEAEIAEAQKRLDELRAERPPEEEAKN